MQGGLPRGEVFGDFEILDVAGQGGMGVVYRARQVSLGRVVALKIISPDVASSDAFKRRFAYESRLAASIDHPHVVSIFSSGEVDGRSFIAMQWVEGVGLDRLIAGGDPLTGERAALIVSQVAQALDAAHSEGLIHRDVKPANILVRSIRGRDHTYLTDFGIARHSGAEVTGLTKTGETVGTIGYMSPEQIRGEPPDGRADLYSLGCVLFESLTGHPPFERDSHPATMFAHVNEERPLPSRHRPDLGGDFDAVTTKAMALEPEDRYGSGAELSDAVLAAGRGQPAAAAQAPTRAATAAAVQSPPTPAQQRAMAAAGPPASPPGPSEAPTQKLRDSNRTWLLAVVGGLAVLVVALGAFAATGGFDGGEGVTTTLGAEETAAPSDSQDGSQGGAAGPDGISATAESEIREILLRYESAYTNQDLEELGALFAPDVTRRGLRAGGCDETSGVDEVLDTYEEQFAAGTGTYTLTDLGSIDVAGETATADSGYTIEPGSSGSVSFDLERGESGWLITRVDASC